MLSSQAMIGRSAERGFRRSFDSLGEIFAFMDAFFEADAIGSAADYALRFGVEELFTNMVKYNPKGAGEILLALERHPDRVSASLTDFDADRFDIREAAPVDTGRPIEERTPGGLGIHLVRTLMDRIDYEYEGRRGRTTFVKMLE